MQTFEQILGKIKSIKAERKITNVEFAKLTNLPSTTINRILSGDTQNPTIETILPMCIALGISLDELMGLKTSDSSPVSAPVVTALDSYAELLKEKDERIKELKEEKEKIRKEKLRFGVALACIVGFLLLLLTVDILNGHFGYFRY